MVCASMDLTYSCAFCSAVLCCAALCYVNVIVMSSSSSSDAITVQSIHDLHTDLSLATCERACGILHREGISTFSLLGLVTEERLEKLLIPAGIIAVLAAQKKLLNPSGQYYIVISYYIPAL